MRIRSLAFFIAFTALCSPALASSFVVVPNNQTTTHGNGTDSISPSDPDTRFQQLYGSGQFSSGPILIDQFAFRLSPGTGGLNVSFANLDLYMSTSPRYPNPFTDPALLMSTTFATNVGPDNTLVYHGPLTLSGNGCAFNGPLACPFEAGMTVTLQHPFLYDPNVGRLLLDFSISGISLVLMGHFDDQDFSQNLPPLPPYGSIASVAGPLGTTVASDFSAGGDITQFRFTAVPEPATMTLLLVGLGAGAAARRRRVS